MNEKKLKVLANELAKDLKTPEDLTELTAQTRKNNSRSSVKCRARSSPWLHSFKA